MKVYQETSLQAFNAWSGGADTLEELTNEEINVLQDFIEEITDETGISATELNDFLWFEKDQIAKALGYEDWEDLLKHHKS